MDFILALHDKNYKEQGSNKYNIPYIHTSALACHGLLQHTLKILGALVNEIQEVLTKKNNSSEQSAEAETFFVKANLFCTGV